MNIKRPYLAELLTAVALILLPFVLPWLGFSPSTINRILIWGLFGIGFDLLFGYTGLLSFGQSAFYGTGGMFAAYLLTEAGFDQVMIAIIIGAAVTGVVGYVIGLIALRRTGIYFAMITVAIAEVFFFVEFNPLSAFTGGENGLPGVPQPQFNLGFTVLKFNTDWSMYSLRCASSARRSARSCRPSATTRCARRRWATTSTATSSPPSSWPPSMPASPAGCSPRCRASCRRTPSCSRRRDRSS